MQYSDTGKRRRKTIFRIVFLLAFVQLFLAIKTFSETSSSDHEKLHIVGKAALPLRELSGFTRDDATGRIMAVGDSSPELVSFDLTETSRVENVRIDSFRDAILDTFPFCSHHSDAFCQSQLAQVTSQWEAAQAFEGKRLALLQETSNSIFFFDAQGLSGIIGFHFDKDDNSKSKSKRKKRPKSYRGEGMVILSNGHILVAKEQSPASIVELAPYGEDAKGFLPSDPGGAWPNFAEGPTRREYNVVATWRRADDPMGECNLTEMTRSPDGALYLLSQTCHQIVRLEELDPATHIAKPSKVWRFSKKIKNAEALLVFAPDKVLVGSDKKQKKTNVYLLRAN